MNEARLGEYDRFLDSGDKAAFNAAIANDKLKQSVPIQMQVEIPDAVPEGIKIVTQLIETHAGRRIELSNSYSRKDPRTLIGYVLDTDDPTRGKTDLKMLTFANGQTLFVECFDDVPKNKRDFQAISNPKRDPLLLVGPQRSIKDVVFSLQGDLRLLSAKPYFELMIPSRGTFDLRGLTGYTLAKYLPQPPRELTPGISAPIRK